MTEETEKPRHTARTPRKGILAALGAATAAVSISGNVPVPPPRRPQLQAAPKNAPPTQQHPLQASKDAPDPLAAPRMQAAINELADDVDNVIRTVLSKVANSTLNAVTTIFSTGTLPTSVKLPSLEFVIMPPGKGTKGSSYLIIDGDPATKQDLKGVSHLIKLCMEMEERNRKASPTSKPEPLPYKEIVTRIIEAYEKKTIPVLFREKYIEGGSALFSSLIPEALGMSATTPPERQQSFDLPVIKPFEQPHVVLTVKNPYRYANQVKAQSPIGSDTKQHQP